MRQRGKTKLGLAGLVLASIASVFGLGCDDGNGGNGEENTAPYATGFIETTAEEDSNYNVDLMPMDNEGDTVVCTPNSVPTGASVTPEGVVNWTPTNDQSNQDYSFSVNMSDGALSEDVTWNVHVNGVGSPQFTIESAGVRAKLANVDVTLDSQSNSNSYSVTTDATGIAQFPNIPDDDYTVTVTDNTGVHDTHKPGTLVVSKDKESQNKLEKTLRLYEQADRTGINETARFTGQVNRPAQPFTFNIYTTEWQSGTRVDQSLIDNIVAKIKGEVATFNQTTYTDADINIIDSLPLVGQPSNGIQDIAFDNSMSPNGLNLSYFDTNNNILSGKSILKTSASNGVQIQEIIEACKGGAETEQFLSVLNDSPPDALQPKDYAISDIQNNRPTGNMDLGSSEDHDVNPSTYIVNQ